MDGEQHWGESVFSVGWRKLLRALERNNFFYLISALLMLIGCYIVVLPYLFVYQNFDGLVVLLTVINIYEILVIAACAFIIRKLPGSGESATLLFVELLFLLDATCTINGCLVIHFWKGLAIMGVSLAAAIGKVYALEAAAHAKVFHRLKAVLLPAIVFTMTFQPLQWIARDIPLHAREMASYALWMLYGTLPLLLLFTRADLGQLSGWKSARFRRALLGVAIILPGYQLAGQTWVYRAPFSVSFLPPLIFSLLVLLPELWKKLSRDEAQIIRIITAVGLLAGCALAENTPWQLSIRGHALLLTPMRMNLAFAACSFLIMWLREDRPVQLSLACAFSAFALMGHDAQSIFDFPTHPDWVMLAATIPIAHLWLRYNRGYWRMLGVASVYILCIGTGLSRDTALDGRIEALSYWPVVAFFLSLFVGMTARNWQMGLLSLVCCIGVARYPVDEWAALIYFVVGFATICAARVFLRKNTVFLITAYFSAAGYMRFGIPRSESHINWGWVVIALAFMFFGAAFFVTRSRINHTRIIGAELPNFRTDA